MNKLVIHSPRLQCNAYLIDLLHAAVWLSESRRAALKDSQSVEIWLHPVGSPWTKLAHGLIDPKTLFRYIDRRLRGMRRRSVDHPGVDPVVDTESLIEQIHRRRTVTIQGSGRTKIIVGVRAVGVVRSAVHTLGAIFRTWRAWMTCSARGRLDIEGLLALSYRDVRIGDLVASTVLSGETAAGGSLRDCRLSAILLALFDAIYTLDHIARTSEIIHQNEYVTVPESTYLEAIYLRALQHAGLTVLELYDYRGTPCVYSPGESLRRPEIARPTTGPSGIKESENAERYLQERLANDRKHLWYMHDPKNAGIDDELVDQSVKPLARDDNLLTIVIFLHSCIDAQYSFGTDGFEDLYDWTLASIDGCLRNPQVGRVLIKRHPGIDLERYPGDKYAEEKLRVRYLSDEKVTFINRHANINNLTTLGRVYGITHHGSVAEELVAAGIPCIASTHAPWGDNYAFLRVWHRPQDYRQILQGLTVDGWQAPGSAEREALVRFVTEYRLSVKREAALPISMQWMVWKDRETDIRDPDLSEKTERSISALRGDSPELIDWLGEWASIYARSALEPARS